MKVYVLKDEIVANECRQLIRLKADCSRLEWSKVIKKTPSNVVKALSVIDDFVDEKLEEFCADNVGKYTVSEKEETQILAELKKNSLFRNLVGSGVVLKSEVHTLEDNMNGLDAPILKEALAVGKNLVIY